MKAMINLKGWASVGLLLLSGIVGWAQKPELVVQTGHSELERSVTFNPDGTILATGGRDRMVKLWDVRTGRILRTLGASLGMVTSVAFSPNGTMLAAGSTEDINVWNVVTGRKLFTFNGRGPICFSPTGNTIAGATRENEIVIWDTTSGKEVRTITAFRVKLLGGNSVSDTIFRKTNPYKKHFDEIESIDFSQDGKMLAAGGTLEPAFAIWNVATGEEIFKFPAQQFGNCSGANCAAISDFEVYSVRFNFDNNTLAVTNGGWWVGLYDVRTRKWTVQEAEKGFGFLCFSPDRKRLIGTSEGDKIVFWDLETGKSQLHFEKVNYPNPGLAVISADGRTFAITEPDHAIAIWDVATEERRTIKAAAADVSGYVGFSSDGNRIITWGNGIRIWSLTANTAPESRKWPDKFSSVSLSPDRKMLAAANYENVIKVWEFDQDKLVLTLNGPDDQHALSGLAFSQDNKFLVSRTSGGLVYESEPGVVRVWNLDSGRIVQTLDRDFGSGNDSIAFQPNGKLIATAGSSNPVDHYAQIEQTTLWDTGPGSEAHDLVWRRGGTPIAFSPDGKLLATMVFQEGLNLWINIWNVSDWTDKSAGQTHSLVGHAGPVLALAFSPDSRILASASRDSTIKLWDVITGHELRTLSEHSSRVISVAFSANGEFLISGSDDNTTKIWRVETGELLASLIAIDELDWLVVTPDGLFDGSPKAWQSLLWRFNNNTFDNAPMEAFFSEFYYPGLLTDIFAGKRPKAPSDISQKDRRQVPVTLRTVGTQDANKAIASRTMTLQVQVEEAPAGPDVSDKNKSLPPSGARDVRLFRNGSLVKLWSGDLFALSEKDGCQLQAKTSPQSPRGSICTVTVPIVAGPNNFTAYAFNSDNVKSGDATLTVAGGDSLKRKGALHILAVGVSQYANREYNLDYTTDDATSFAAQLKLEQEKLSKYQSVEIKTLLNESATKENILAELQKLAAAVQPEDAVVVYFSGHGKASGDHFYLVPHDLGYSGSRDQLSDEGLQQILKHSVSDLELEEAFRGIDAGQMFMIIDACNSGQALENKDEPRRGPMNTRGLAQLAYEKGMYIMTASQNVEEAFVSEKLKHSYLTYALVEEGLKTKAADIDHNGEITLREWFDYALARVPKLREETLQSKALEEVNPTRKAAVRNQKSQTPRVFYRREAETNALIVAKISASK